MPDDRSHDEKLATVLADMTDAVQRGENVVLDEVCRRHPEIAEELRQLWGAAAVADVAGDSSSERAVRSSPSMSVQSSSFELPCRFGEYELLEELGRGGMGVVYRARHTVLDRHVAIKMILSGALASKADLERFGNEAVAAGQLDHPGIVPLYEFSDVDGQAYFAMKHVPGCTLADKLAEGPMPTREAARLVASIARAVEFAHRHGILHRDIKPSNVLLDEAGEPHLTDFGLAKKVDDGGSLTRSGAILGTPSYMAPEQAAGARGEMGPPTDIYSLGSILYHALTGRPPFQAASPLDTILLLLDQEPLPPRMINPGVDRDLERICLRCLQKPTDLRYESAEKLADDLEAFLNDESISAQSASIFQVVARLFRETHHATVLENWGLLWMLHSLALIIACTLTNILHLMGVQDRWYYFALWTAGLGTWAAVFWTLRRRMGPVMFVERQIAHVWAASMIAIALLFPIEFMLGFEPLKLSPVLGLVTGMVFVVKAGILSGTFYVQAIALFATGCAMAQWPRYGHFIFGAVSAACFFLPGLKYYRRARAVERREGAT